jgi:hypothetical protein
MDLLKNLLFMRARSSEFAALKTRWKELVDTLHKAGEKPLRFLRYFIHPNYAVETLVLAAATRPRTCSLMYFPCYLSCYFPAHSLFRFQTADP